MAISATEDRRRGERQLFTEQRVVRFLNLDQAFGVLRARLGWCLFKSRKYHDELLVRARQSRDGTVWLHVDASEWQARFRLDEFVFKSSDPSPDP